jgi:hypothetical protein
MTTADLLSVLALQGGIGGVVRGLVPRQRFLRKA